MAEKSLASVSILIVEDEVLIALDLSDTFRAAGAEVVGPAGTADDALTLLDEHRIDAAVVDVNLGDGDSLPVVHALARTGVPFVYYTGHETPASLGWPRAKVIKKPAVPSVLLTAVSELLPPRDTGG